MPCENRELLGSRIALHRWTYNKVSIGGLGNVCTDKVVVMVSCTREVVLGCNRRFAHDTFHGPYVGALLELGELAPVSAYQFNEPLLG